MLPPEFDRAQRGKATLAPAGREGPGRQAGARCWAVAEAGAAPGA